MGLSQGGDALLTALPCILQSPCLSSLRMSLPSQQAGPKSSHTSVMSGTEMRGARDTGQDAASAGVGAGFLVSSRGTDRTPLKPKQI